MTFGPTHRPKNLSIHRARQELAWIGRDFPGIWHELEMRRDVLKKTSRDSLLTAFVPISSVKETIKTISDIRIKDTYLHPWAEFSITTLSTWRINQNIYRLVSPVFENVWATSVLPETPTYILNGAPDWSIYIETPNVEVFGHTLHGFWVQTIKDTVLKADYDAELVVSILLDFSNKSLLAILPLKDSVIGPLLKSESFRLAPLIKAQYGKDVSSDDVRTRLLEPIMSTYLFICSKQGCFVREGDGINHRKKKTAAVKLNPVRKASIWLVGQDFCEPTDDSSDLESIEFDPDAAYHWRLNSGSGGNQTLIFEKDSE